MANKKNAKGTRRKKPKLRGLARDSDTARRAAILGNKRRGLKNLVRRGASCSEIAAAALEGVAAARDVAAAGPAGAPGGGEDSRRCNEQERECAAEFDELWKWATAAPAEVRDAQRISGAKAQIKELAVAALLQRKKARRPG